MSTTFAFRLRLLIAPTAALAIGAIAVIAAPDTAHAKRYCQGDRHMHYGSGSGPTKRTAKRSAIASWSGFTAFEYGNAYARFSNARFKRVRCGKSSGGWSCSVEGNPCRRAR
ncbi:MAG: hypothetical protein AAGJ70_06440 [Pseudomonadota bacterium]